MGGKGGSRRHAVTTRVGRRHPPAQTHTTPPTAASLSRSQRLRVGARHARDGAPLAGRVAAVSCGIYKGTPVLDLDYIEDSSADADANFVLLEGGLIAEVQATAEGATYDEEALLRLLRLARIGCDRIFAGQAAAVGR